MFRLGFLTIFLPIAWCTYVCLRIYFRQKLVSFLLIGLSLPIYLFSMPLDKILKIILQITSNTFFWVGVAIMGTYEKDKLMELGASTTFKDWTTGNIPEQTIRPKHGESKIQQVIFFLGSLILMAVAIVNYFIYAEVFESVAMFITGLLFIFFYLKNRV